MYALDEILVPETFDEVLEEMLALAASFGAPTTAWIEGGPVLTQIMTASQKISDLTKVAVEIGKANFGDLLPSDDWADLWGLSRFNQTRVASTAAAGYGTAVNASDQDYPLDPGDFIVAHDVTGKTYRNVDAITILANATLADIAISADEPGIASNAATGAITTIVSSLVGVTFANTGTLIGTDKETTEAFVERSRASLSALSPNGAKDAYRYVATTPYLPDGTACAPTSVPITRARNYLDVITGILYVYIATASGAPSAPDVAIVQNAFDQLVEPWGARVVAVAATELVFNITYQSWLRDTQLTTAQIESAQATALATWFSTLDIGGYVIPPDTGALYVDAIEQEINKAIDGTLRARVTVPASDTVLSAFEVATLGTITATTTVLE